MKLSEIEYPLRLCVELLHFASISCEKTQSLKAGDIKVAAGAFFTDEQIESAIAILQEKHEEPALQEPGSSGCQGCIIKPNQMFQVDDNGRCVKCGVQIITTQEQADATREPGFYWTIIKAGGRWEVSEWDGAAWNNGDDEGRIFRVGERVEEPK